MVAGLVMTTLQSRLLQVPSVRAKLGIAPMTATLPPTSLMDTYRHIYRYLQQQFGEGSLLAKKIRSKSDRAARR